jgi:hypothetical protein
MGVGFIEAVKRGAGPHAAAAGARAGQPLALQLTPERDPAKGRAWPS